jgi:hypothetical protein
MIKIMKFRKIKKTARLISFWLPAATLVLEPKKLNLQKYSKIREKMLKNK